MATVESLDRLVEIVRESHTLAVVGISTNASRDSHRVAEYMQSKSRQIVGVNPAYSEALGAPCFPSLGEIPDEIRQTVDLVVIFRKPEAVVPILEEAAQLGLGKVWLQLGVSSPAALQRADELGLEVVAEKCVRVVHQLNVRDE